jgi:hypothetical protein
MHPTKIMSQPMIQTHHKEHFEKPVALQVVILASIERIKNWQGNAAEQTS